MKQKNALHKNAKSGTIALPGMLGLKQIATALAVPRGTLIRRLNAYNRAAPGEGWASIRPDLVDGSYRVHFFHETRLPEFKAMLQVTLATRKPGRPRKSTPK